MSTKATRVTLYIQCNLYKNLKWLQKLDSIAQKSGGCNKLLATCRYEADYWEYSHLCDLCHGTAGRYCVRNHMEDYFGHTGAFRCLVEVRLISDEVEFLGNQGTNSNKSLQYLTTNFIKISGWRTRGLREAHDRD